MGLALLQDCITPHTQLGCCQDFASLAARAMIGMQANLLTTMGSNVALLERPHVEANHRLLCWHM